MEPANIEICKLCMRCMIDPRILPCSDSFCLKCLESSEISKNSSKCPVCQIPFKLPKGGLKELKKNEFINCLSNIKHNHNVCDGCKKNQAINFCVDCSFNYCSTCLEHHGRFPTTSNHQLRPISSKVKEINVNKYSTCIEHSKEKCLLCLDCKIALCDHCSSLKHKNHKIKPTSEHFESVRIKFEQSLKSKKGILKNVCLNLKSVEDKMYDNGLKGSNLKEEIQQRGEDLKKAIDSIVADLNKNVDKELKRHQAEAADVMKELKHLEATLNEEIDIMNEQLNGLNCENVLETPAQIMNIPNYLGHFEISLYFDADENLANLKKIYGSIGRVPKVRLVNEDKIDEEIYSYDLFGGDIFVCCINEDQYEVKKLIQHSELTESSSKLKDKKFIYKLDDLDELISNVEDMLIIDDLLFVAGTSDDECGYVVKFHMGRKRCKQKQIFEHPLEDKTYWMRLSKSLWECILVILKNKIVELSDDGDVLKTIDLTFDIIYALPFDLKSYIVCCPKEVCIIDDKGFKIRNSSCGEYRALTAPCCLVKDKRGDTYAVDIFTKKLFVFDHHLIIKMSLDLTNDFVKLCYDKERDVLMAIDEHNSLLTFEL